MAMDGRFWRLYTKIGGQWVPFAGAQEESMSHSNSAVDRTAKESDGYRHMLENAGRSVDLSLSAIAKPGVGMNAVLEAVRDNTFIEMRAEASTSVLESLFQISNYRESGTSSQAVSFSASLQSAGQYVYKTGVSLVERDYFLGALTRNTVATYWDKNGILQTAAVDEPRHEYNLATGEYRGLLIEQEATNHIKYSEATVADNYWDARGATLSDTVVRGKPGLRLTADADGFINCLVKEGVAFPNFNNEMVNRSLVVRISDPQNMLVQFRNSGTADNAFYTSDDRYHASFDLTGAGSVTNKVGRPSIQPLGDGIFRIMLHGPKSSNGAANQGFSFSICQKSSSSNGGTYEAACNAGDWVEFTAAEYVTGPINATSYIPTDGSESTRAKDDARITNLAPFNGFAEGTFICEFETESTDDDSQYKFPGSIISGTGRLASYLAVSLDNTLAVVPLYGGDVLDSRDGLNKCAITFTSGGDLRYCANGGPIGTAPWDSRFNITDALVLGLMGWSGWLKPTRFVPRNVSDNELQELTR